MSLQLYVASGPVPVGMGRALSVTLQRSVTAERASWSVLLLLAALVTRVDGAYQPGVCKRAVVPSWIRTCVPLFPLLGLGAERGAERERERVCDIVIYDEPDLGRGIS